MRLQWPLDPRGWSLVVSSGEAWPVLHACICSTHESCLIRLELQ